MDTIEIRWFFEEPPKALQQLAGESEDRIDWYAPVASPDSSVKWREQRLEGKFLTDRMATDLASETTGWQRWSKVSIALPAAETRRTRQLVEANWLPVQKERTIHLFCVDRQGQVEPADHFTRTPSRSSGGVSPCPQPPPGRSASKVSPRPDPRRRSASWIT